MQIQPTSRAVSDATFNFTIICYFYLRFSASFLAHRIEAIPLIREKSIFCFLALFSLPSKSLFIVWSSNSAPESDVFTYPFCFLCEGGVMLQTGSSCTECSGLKASTNCGHRFWNTNYSSFSPLSIINVFCIWDSIHSCECWALEQGYHQGHRASTPRSRSAMLVENVTYEPNPTKQTDMCLMQWNNKPVIFCCAWWHQRRATPKPLHMREKAA